MKSESGKILQSVKKLATRAFRHRAKPDASPARPQKIEKASAGDGHWSRRVSETSDALDLLAGVFTLTDPREIALSLKKSADASQRRKTEPFRSAMSMLTFYINRAGRHLPQEQRDLLEQAKDELRNLYGRPRQIPRQPKKNGK